jgi:peptidoglycan pentaglycine glycine transferase (the first glycine)
VEHYSLYNGSAWNQLIARLPASHLLQTAEWGQVKSRYGWTPVLLTWGGAQIKAAAMVLKRGLALPGLKNRLSIFYIPKGPLLDWEDHSLRRIVLEDLGAFARKQGAVFIKIDPEVAAGYGIPGNPDAVDAPGGEEVISDLVSHGWHLSKDQVQFKNTVILDLTQPEQELLAGMKQKTRYNIRLAERKGVQVRAGTQADLDLLYRMYAETSIRDGFVIRHEGYYRDLWGTFMANGAAEPLIAEVEGEPTAAVIIFRFAKRAWYLYGMSRPIHREKMPNHLLQWEAIRRSKAAGCTAYDLWGAPDEFNENDTLWGVYRFKEGLGGQVVRTIGAWDLPARPGLYRTFTQILPQLLNLMRRRGTAQTRRTLDPT